MTRTRGITKIFDAVRKTALVAAASAVEAASRKVDTADAVGAARVADIMMDIAAKADEEGRGASEAYEADWAAFDRPRDRLGASSEVERPKGE